MRPRGKNTRFRFLTILNNGANLEKSKIPLVMWSLSILDNLLSLSRGTSTVLKWPSNFLRKHVAKTGEELKAEGK
jgi:hypothetical protein